MCTAIVTGPIFPMFPLVEESVARCQPDQYASMSVVQSLHLEGTLEQAGF